MENCTHKPPAINFSCEPQPDAYRVDVTDILTGESLSSQERPTIFGFPVVFTDELPKGEWYMRDVTDDDIRGMASAPAAK